MLSRMARSPHVRISVAGACAILGVLLGTPRLDFDAIATGAGLGETALVWDKETVEQTFRLAREGLTEIAIAVDPIPSPQADVEFQIRRAENKAPLRVASGPAEEFLSEDGRVLRFRFSPLADVADVPLAFTLAAPGTARKAAIPLRVEVASSLYPNGNILMNGVARDGDLGFTARVRGGWGESWRHRLLVDTAGQWFAGLLVAVLGLLLAVDARSWRRSGRTPMRGATIRLVVLGSLAVALLYTFPLYAHLGNWADDESDWPEVVSTFAATREALTAGQFPGWNPYICGGAPHFANPQGFFMALPLPLALLVGDIVGPKIGMTLVIALGVAGTIFLARTLGLHGPAAILPGIVFLFSGFTTAHLANGQLLWLTLAWVPWVVLGFLRALRNPWWSLVAAGFLILTFVEGRVYLVAYAALLLSVLAVIFAVQQRSRRPLAILVLVGALTLSGSAWKLLPTLTFLADSETSLGNDNGVSWRLLDDAFFRRDVAPNITDRAGDLDIPRHEYAAYVGILPILVALLGLHRTTRARALPFLLTGLTFLFLATQDPQTSLLEHFPLTRELRNPSRMLSMVVFNVAIAAGFGLTVLQHILTTPRSGTGKTRGALVPLLVLLLILGDLLAVGWTHLGPLFDQPPRFPAFDAPEFFQTRLPTERQVNNGYPAVAAGKGAKDFCPVVLRAYRPVHHVLAREDAGYRGEVRAEGRSRVELTRFTPNALDIAVDAPEEDTIVVNQQYDRGWSASPFLTREHHTLLAVDVPPGLHTVHLRYRTPFLGVGGAISLTVLAGAAVFWRFRRALRRIVLASPLFVVLQRNVQSRRLRMPRLILAATVLAAGLLVAAPPLPFWGARHLAHLGKAPLTLSSGHTVRQTFRWEADTLDLVVLWIDSTSPRPSDGELLLTVETPFGARTATASLADIPPSGTVVFRLKPALRGRAGGDGALSLRLAHDGQIVGLKYQIAAGIYPDGALTIEGRETQGDLAFQLRYQRAALQTRGRVWTYAILLLIAGTIVAAAIARPPSRPAVPRFARRDLLQALAAGIVAGGVYGGALLGHGFWVGASDFSKDAAYLQSAGEALDQGAWPTWSHRTCGGMLLLGNPEGNTLSLGTIFATVLHADQALLRLLVIEAGLAAAGTVLLARFLRLSVGASLAAAAVASLSASFAYRILEGLTPVGGAVAFTSWTILALLWALETASGPAAILTGTLLAAMFFRGDVHVVVGVLFVVLAIALIVALRRRSVTPLLLLGVIGATFFLWSSIKLLPYLEQPSLVGGDLPPYVVPLTRMGLLDDALLRLHDRGGVDVRPLHDRRLEQWGNFGAYVGITPLVLAGIGLFARHPQRTVIVTGAVLAFLLSEGELFEVVLRHLGPLGVLLRVPSRLFSLFAVFLGLLAGLGLDHLGRDFPRWRRAAISGALLAFLAVNLAGTTRTLFARNLEWNTVQAPPQPPEPTLASHANVSPDHTRHATKLLHAGYLLPRICGDQNNPPPFVRDVRDPTPLATGELRGAGPTPLATGELRGAGPTPLAAVTAKLRPNRILLDAGTGPSDLIVRERFVSLWKTTRGAVLPADDGALHLVLPTMEPGPVELRAADPLAAAEGALLALFLGALPLLLIRCVQGTLRHAGGAPAPVASPPPAPDAIAASQGPPRDDERSMVRLIIPAYNEAANLPALVQDIATAFGADPYRMYAVNDGSRDNTLTVLQDLATRFPITVLDHVVNKGVAAAFRTGFTAVLADAADDDVIVLMEGDGTSTPSLIPPMTARIREGADVVVASRYQPGGGYRNFPLKRLLLSQGANLIFRTVFPMRGIKDYTIFYRAYRVPPLRACVAHHGERFIESSTFLANAEILVKLRPFVRRVEEVPLLYDYGKKKGKSGMKVGKNLRSYLQFIARHAIGAK